MDEYWRSTETASVTTVDGGALERPSIVGTSYELDSEYHFVAVSDAFLDVTGYSRDALLDAHVSRVIYGYSSESFEETIGALETSDRRTSIDSPGSPAEGPDDAPETVVTLELPLRDAAGEPIPATHQLRYRDDGRADRIVGTVSVAPGPTRRADPDGSDEVRGARGEDETVETEGGAVADGEASTGGTDGAAAGSTSAREVLARVSDGVYALDADLRYTFVNERAGELLADEGDESAVSGSADAVASPFDPAHERALATQRPITVEEYHQPSESWLEATVYPSETGVTVHVRDVTARRERERALEAGNRRLRSVFENAHDAVLVGDDSGIDAANPAATELLDLDRSELVGRSLMEFVHDDHDVNETWAQFQETGHFRGSFSIVRPDGTERVVECNAVADVLPGKHLSILRDVTEGRERERRLERQRERLVALDHVYDVVREINEAIVEDSTRDALEWVTCETLAEAPAYEFAFVAAMDSKTGTVAERAEAGIDGYVDSIPLSADPDDPAGRGPAGRAIRTQEMEVSNDVFADPDFEPWREDARKHGYRSAAAIPITYNGALYGILGITGTNRNAFAAEERAVIGQLGEILGHAIAARERKRALMGDELIELEYEIRDAVDLFDGPPMTDQHVSFDRVVQIDDETFLEYGTTTTETFPALETLADCIPHWEAITVLDESAGEVTFELAISSPPMFSVVADRGGFVESAALDDGDYTMTVRLPKSTDVRAVTSAIKGVYPQATNVARRQVAPASQSIAQMQSHLYDELTERQRTALETAYYAGYFEWPRNSSGEELATALEVTPATFHEHLRSAQRKLVAAVFDEPETTRG